MLEYRKYWQQHFFKSCFQCKLPYLSVACDSSNIMMPDKLLGEILCSNDITGNRVI